MSIVLATINLSINLLKCWLLYITYVWDLILNSHTQIDIDECANDTMNNCEQRCVNTQGSFLCACGTGYQLNNDGMTCSGIFTEIQMYYYIRWLTSYNNV